MWVVSYTSMIDSASLRANCWFGLQIHSRHGVEVDDKLKKVCFAIEGSLSLRLEIETNLDLFFRQVLEMGEDKVDEAKEKAKSELKK